MRCRCSSVRYTCVRVADIQHNVQHHPTQINGSRARTLRWHNHAERHIGARYRGQAGYQPPEAGRLIEGLSSRTVSDILQGMTKRLIDVDDNKLEAVKTLLGTTTLKATVNAALDEVLALDQRRQALLTEHGIEVSELADPDARQAAWG